MFSLFLTMCFSVLYTCLSSYPIFFYYFVCPCMHVLAYSSCSKDIHPNVI